MNIGRDVFEVHPFSIEELFTYKRQCFYIPAYQRSYSWDRTHVERLLEDTAHGVTELLSSDKAITFLGTIITIHDQKYATVDPKIISQLPSIVMTVIDGQQRLTTLLILIAALHNELTTRSPKLNKGDQVPEQWLLFETQETSSTLSRLLEDDYQQGEHQYYPRMIRAYKDQWSRNKDEMIYGSPIAEFLFSYSNYKRENVGRQYTHKGDTDIKTKYNHIRNTLKTCIAKHSENEDVQFPTTNQLINSPYLLNELFREQLPEGVRLLLRDPEDSSFSELFRLLIFSRFVLQRLVVTNVVATSDEYAFDMFDALNTTGEPLTAIETFKPRIVQAETHENYEKSISAAEMKEVEHYLERFTEAPKRQSATAELLVPFALAESGEKIAKRLAVQRRYLMKKYDEYGDVLEDKRQFVRHLARIAIVVDRAWKRETGEPELPGIALTSEEKLCLEVLRDANHHIVLAPLTRFYSLAQSGEIKSEEVGEALRAMAGFFALWRGAFRGTHNIDSRYRMLMSEGSREVGVVPFARSRNGGSANEHVLSAEQLRIFMRHILMKEGIDGKEDWIRKAEEKNVYEESRVLTRLLLLSAAHDSVPDEQEPGLIVPGTKGVLNLLNYETWIDIEGAASVEHVAPQTAAEGWEMELYENDDTIHRLGNLILIRQNENSAIANEPWLVKRTCFKVLSALSMDEIRRVTTEAESAGIKMPVSMSQVSADQRYQPLTAGVARYNGEWTLEMIEKRSRRIAELAWERLAPWVGIV